MSKVSLNNVANLQDTTTAAGTINNNSTAITTAVEKTLSRDGTAPNQMNASLDMNSNHIINLPAPITANDAVRFQDLTALQAGGTVTTLPVGGTTGQSLQKNSNTNYDVKWGGNVTSVGLSLPADFTVTGSPVTTSGTLTATLANTPTGTGGLVRQTSPALTTPALGVASTTSLAVTGTAGAGFVEYPTESSAPSAPASGFREYADSTGRHSWIKTTDGFTRTIDGVLTGNRVYTLPDTSGTVLTTTNAGGIITKFFNALGSDVALNNASNYFDGPSVAQGTSGIWFASGTVTVTDPTGASGLIDVKLWDGTTVIASTAVTTFAGAITYTISVSGVITNPAGNIRISAKSTVSTTGKIAFNTSGNSLDSSVTAFRIG